MSRSVALRINPPPPHADVAGMDPVRAADHAEVMEAALRALLIKHPRALVAAITDDGFFVPMPAAISLLEHRVAQARTAMDLVDPDDRVVVIATWEQVKAQGGGRATVRLPGDAGPATMHFVDIRAIHGVYVLVLVPAHADWDQLAAVAEITRPPPRLVRTRKDGLAVILAAEDEVTSLLGWEPEQLVGHRSLEFIHPDDHDRAISTWLDAVACPGATARARLRHRHRDGRWVWLEISNRNLLDDADAGYVDCEMFDISEEMDAQEAVRASEQLLRRLAGALPVGVVQIDLERSIIYTNSRFYEIIGAAPDADQTTLLGCVVEPDRLEAALADVLAGCDADLELRIDRLDGTGRRRCTLSMRALTSAAGDVTGAVCCLTDITDSSRMRSELERRATFDALTGCVNRPTALAALEHALMTAPDAAAIFVDLNGFKAVNDRLGHGVGDILLLTMAARLRDVVRAGDVVGRIGGDEFLVICPTVDDAAGAVALGERISASLAKPLPLDGASIETKASVGVAWTGDTAAVTADQLVAQADEAMYISKAAGDGRVVLAGVAEGRVNPHRVCSGDLSHQLRDAIKRQEFEVHFQPIVSVDRTRVLGCEALLRWRRGDRVLPAAEFIHVAETTGLICEIGPWVIGEVCRQAAAIRRPDLRWYVNLSPRELAAPLTTAAIGEALDRYGVTPSSLVVEVTEHSGLADGGVAGSVLAELSHLGLEIALDDFGTGGSSLSVLFTVPARWIKLDRRFTAATNTAHGKALVGGVVDLASRIGAEVIAEGIETEAERAAVADLGISWAQGTLFSPPAPLEEALLRARRSGLAVTSRQMSSQAVAAL